MHISLEHYFSESVLMKYEQAYQLETLPTRRACVH